MSKDKLVALRVGEGLDLEGVGGGDADGGKFDNDSLGVLDKELEIQGFKLVLAFYFNKIFSKTFMFNIRTNDPLAAPTHSLFIKYSPWSLPP